MQIYKLFLKNQTIFYLFYKLFIYEIIKGYLHGKQDKI